MMIPLSRRELLARTGTGLGVLGLASLLADESRAAGSPTCAPAATLHPEGQARHSPVHERRPVAGRYVRPETRIDPPPRRDAREPGTQDRAPDPPLSSRALQVPQIRSVESRSARFSPRSERASTTSASCARCTPTCRTTNGPLLMTSGNPSRFGQVWARGSPTASAPRTRTFRASW